MLNTNNDLNELLAEIQSKQFDLEYTKTLAHYFMKASVADRNEINNLIKETPLFESVHTYLEIPKFIKTNLISLKNVPDFYDVLLSEETQAIAESNENYDFPVVLELVPGTICSFREKDEEEHSIYTQISQLWHSSKKKVAASIVAAAILTPATFSLTKGIEWNQLNDHFSFQSTKKNYAKILNEGLGELAKSKNLKVNDLLADLSDKEMKFFMKNLETHNKYVGLDLDKKTIEIQLAIEHYYPNKVKNSYQIAQSVQYYAFKHSIDPILFLSIMKEESNFKQDAYNPSGDYSIVQINYEIWHKAFKDKGREPLDKERLKKDSHYAISRMAEILSILKEDYGHKDPIWYARYHNWKKEHKLPYAKKINKQIATLTALRMDKIAEKLLEMKSLALRVAEVENNLDTDKVQMLVTSLEEIHAEYSDKPNLVAFSEE